MKVQLRSYLVVDRIEPKLVQPSIISAAVFIKNAGATPARIKSVNARLWIAAAPNNNPLANGPQPESYYHLRDWFPQGAEDRILITNESTALIGKLNENDKFDAFIYGRIEFEDVFGEGHWMSFAYTPRIWGFQSNTEYGPCIHGNDGD